MGKVEQISVELSQDLLAAVRQAVASGSYASSSDVLEEALRDWARQRERAGAIEELRRLIAEGHASGSAPFEGVEHIKLEGRRRLAELQSRTK